MNDVMTLVEKRIIKKSSPFFEELDYLTFLSKNLYNSTLYYVRQHYFQTGEYLNYNEVNRIFTHEDQEDYRALPAKVSKMTQMLVDKSFKSFFSLLRKKDSGSYNKPVRIPKYLDSITGRQVVTYSKQALKKKKSRPGEIGLSGTDLWIQTDRDLDFIRVVPIRGNRIKLELGYKKECKELVNSNITASIDLGVNNLAVVSIPNTRSLIINGKPLKSINQYYNKCLAKEKSYISKFKLENGLERKHSNKISRLHIKRNNKVDDYLHKATRILVNHLVSFNVSTVVVGYNKGWKQDTSMGRNSNQKFVQIPFLRFIEILTYKCALEGIKVVLQEESYTSKCSFFDGEDVCKQTVYKGKRVERGLFRTSKGLLVNADVNGSLNILKKYLLEHEAWNDSILLDCVEAFSTPLVSTIKL